MSGKGNLAPVRLTSPRVYRTYLGGKLLDQFHGKETGEDGHFPEEWIASLVTARNSGREEMTEGLSMVADCPGISLKELIEADPKGYLGEGAVFGSQASIGVLVKLIDSAERLTVQVHPDRERARELFFSPYGKTECWYILGGRSQEGAAPCVYLGFRPEVDKAKWKDCFERQDVEAMLGCLHRFEVKEGEVILIEGGVPHAIGAGCFLLEIQEPTDYTLRVEKTTPSGSRIDDFMCHQGLGFEKMFECFHYEGISAREARERWFAKPELLLEEGGNRRVRLIGYEKTPCFSMELLEVDKILTIPADHCSVLYVLEGRGELEWGENKEILCVGNSFFVPATAGEIRVKAEEKGAVKLVQCLGPEDLFCQESCDIV